VNVGAVAWNPFFSLLCVRLILSIASAAVVSLPAWAEYPDRLVRIIVPFPPGGATDVVGRALGSRLTLIWNQQVIIENKPGAGGNIGADAVAKATADGHTLLLASPAEIAINPSLYGKMPYDPAKDLIAVSKVAGAPLVLVVHPSIPVTTLKDLISYLKSQGDAVPYASSGTGGPQHLAAEQFRLLTRTNLVHVPYKGGAPAMADLLGGQTKMFFAGVPPALPHIKSGRIRALAVTTAERSSLLPDLPTLVESGLSGFDIENWQGLFAPAGTPAAVVEKVAQDVAAIVRDKNFTSLLVIQGAVPATLPPKEFAAFVQAESRKFARIILEAGVKAD
jgi:tripartite-type tricarboxylate transporter receptor subunit TctC